MKSILTLAFALIAAPLAASPGVSSLPGVADQETEIAFGGIQQFERGHGDVLFVRDSTDRWYRLGLNNGCLKGSVQMRQIQFRNSAGSRIDRFTRVVLPDDLRSCSIDSILRSAPPPQVDSHSPVKLD